MFVKRYALHSVKRPWFHRINILLVLFVFSLSVYELLANEEFILLIGYRIYVHSYSTICCGIIFQEALLGT